MQVESGAVAALALGFLLGLKHATDADHVVAVSTIVSEYRNAWRGIWVGVSWGVGHTAPLLVLGTIILIFQDSVVGAYGSAAPVLEFGVGIMLVFLGGQVFWNLARGRLHVHKHVHDEPHVHIHGTHGPNAGHRDGRAYGFFHFGKPFFRVKSFLIGVIHGLAGSAAVMLALLPALSSFWAGICYLVLFGVGTVLSMAVVTLALGVPFAASSGARLLNRTVTSAAGMASVVLGSALMSDIVLGTSLVPF